MKNEKKITFIITKPFMSKTYNTDMLRSSFNLVISARTPNLSRQCDLCQNE